MGAIVITGASMGIGRALALAWAARGKTVVLSARGKEALDKVAREVEHTGGSAVVVPGDVTDEADRRALVDEAERAGGIDVLVNNAGRGFYARAAEIDIDEMRRVFDLNVFAPLRLGQLAVPALERSKGTIVMMSSVAGVVAAPAYAAYSSSKFALEAIAMAMRAELAKKGIRIVVVRPGPVATPFRANAARGKNMTGYDAPDPKSQTAEEVARITLRAVDRNKPVVATSAFVRVATAASRIAPWAVRAVLERMPEPK
jgi:short-subunit dehydrogenase